MMMIECSVSPPPPPPPARDPEPQPLFSIRGIDDDVSNDDATGFASRRLMATGGDLLKQMHRMRHRDHKDEGLNLTRSMLAGRISKMNNKTKARLIKVKKAAAPPKASVKPKKTKAPTPSSDGTAPGPGASESTDVAVDDSSYEEWTDDDFDDFNEDDYLEDLLKECAKDKAVAIFSCDAQYAEMCKVAVNNLEAMGVGHLAIASDEDVCDTLGYDDICCTVAEDLVGEEYIPPEDSMYTMRWQYVEIALGFNYDVILQDCDVLWTKNPVADFRSDPEVGIIGLRERGTAIPFNGGLTWFRSDRAAVTRLVRDINERVDFFTGVKEEPFRLEELGIDKKCNEGDEAKKLFADASVYNDALESSALNDDVYTRSRLSCDPDGRDTKFNCIKGFPETGCLMLEPDFGSGDGFPNFKSRNGKLIKCSTDPDATPEDDKPAVATDADAEAAPAAEEEEKKTEEESTPAADVNPAESSADAAPAAADEVPASSNADADAATGADEDTTSSTPVAEEAPAADEQTTTESTDEPPVEEAPVAQEESSSESAEGDSSAERRHRHHRLHHRRRLLANPHKLRRVQLYRRAMLQDDEAATSSEDSAPKAESAPSAEEDMDFTEKPAKACVAADDVLASWQWSEDNAGKEGKWSLKNPSALAYGFVGAAESVTDRLTEMKKVMEN